MPCKFYWHFIKFAWPHNMTLRDLLPALCRDRLGNPSQGLQLFLELHQVSEVLGREAQLRLHLVSRHSTILEKQRLHTLEDIWLDFLADILDARRARLRPPLLGVTGWISTGSGSVRTSCFVNALSKKSVVFPGTTGKPSSSYSAVSAKEAVSATTEGNAKLHSCCSGDSCSPTTFENIVGHPCSSS